MLFRVELAASVMDNKMMWCSTDGQGQGADNKGLSGPTTRQLLYRSEAHSLFSESTVFNWSVVPSALDVYISMYIIII